MSHDIVPTDHNESVPPVENPGIDPHVERYLDADPAAGERAYRRIMFMLGLVPLLAAAFVAVYFAVPRNGTVYVLGNKFFAQPFFLGLTGGLGAVLIGVSLVSWARNIMDDHEIAQERHPLCSDEASQAEALEAVNAGITESKVGRRPLILKWVIGGAAIMLVPAIVMLDDLGPHPTKAVRAQTIEKTIWAQGVRLVNDVNALPLKASDIVVGQLVNGEPETLFKLEGAEFQKQKAKAAIIVVRMDPASIKIPASRKDWQVDGILAYSKICTHVGCPVTLWEQQTHHLLCPCHQSTFDLGDSGVVIFGPAGHALPQLPIAVDSEGYLVAKSDFTVPVGPSYFERDSRNDFKEGDN